LSSNHATFIWSIADLLRRSFKAHQYADIILLFTVLRRLDAVLAPTQRAVFAAVEEAKKQDIPVLASLLRNTTGHDYSFWNESRFDMATVLGDSENITANLLDYVNGFSENVKDIFDKCKIAERLVELEEHDLLFLVNQKFAEVDLSPATVPNEEMAHIFEELIRKFAEAANETVDTAIDFETPPTIVIALEDVIYDSSTGHNYAIKALLTNARLWEASGHARRDGFIREDPWRSWKVCGHKMTATTPHRHGVLDLRMARRLEVLEEIA
jgi:type I restriction enzyme M protein